MVAKKKNRMMKKPDRPKTDIQDRKRTANVMSKKSNLSAVLLVRSLNPVYHLSICVGGQGAAATTEQKLWRLVRAVLLRL